MYKNYFKRLFDIVLSIVGLIGLVIVFIPISLLIYFEDKGSIFYNSPRLGKDGKLFKMYKFRSMKMDAPDIRLEDGSTYNSKDDPRVTKIGKFIRETSIDEIPQILNILIGDMSLIGPRPDPPDWLEIYTQDEKIFLTIKPGITGYSQAYFRNSADGKEKIKNDVYYALNIGFWLDVKIFFKTILNIFKRENMYKPIEQKDRESNMGL